MCISRKFGQHAVDKTRQADDRKNEDTLHWVGLCPQLPAHFTLPPKTKGRYLLHLTELTFNRAIRQKLKYCKMNRRLACHSRGPNLNNRLISPSTTALLLCCKPRQDLTCNNTQTPASMLCPFYISQPARCFNVQLL